MANSNEEDKEEVDGASRVNARVPASIIVSPNIISNVEDVGEFHQPVYEMSQQSQSMGMGNTEMEGEESVLNINRTQRSLKNRGGGGGPKTRKERKANVMMSEAESRTKASLERLSISNENVDCMNRT